MERETIIRVQTALLLQVVAGLFAMLPEGCGDTLARWLHLKILAILRPAEAATRRVIAIAATLVTTVPAAAKRKMPLGGIPAKKGEQAPVFALFDPRKYAGPSIVHVPGRGPQVRPLDGSAPRFAAKAPPLPDDPINAACVLRRMEALRTALTDVSKQGKRLAQVLAHGRSKYRRVMRPGRPPGHRERGTRLIDDILADCHALALRTLHEVEVADTS